MKICAVVCELDPLHNGHLYLMDKLKAESGCDKLLLIMSGNFTQRGEAAVLAKDLRAREAVLCGADAVLELPAAFAVSPAELFAGGAVKLLASIPSVSVLGFGCENGSKEDFMTAAGYTMSESKRFKALLKDKMRDGTSYVRAFYAAVAELCPSFDLSLIASPNNLLGVEYCRAILRQGSGILPMPVKRMGADHRDETPARNYSSASALRLLLSEESRRSRRILAGNVPACVKEDLLGYPRPEGYKKAALCALLAANAPVSAAPDCSEGLENRLAAFARSNPDYDLLVGKVVSKRYTRARIKRILLQNFLGIDVSDVREFLASPLYLKPLALKKEGAEEMLKALAESPYPTVVRKSDFSLLKKEALACFLTDCRANDLYGALTGRRPSDYETLFL